MAEADMVDWREQYNGDAYDIMAEKPKREGASKPDTTETLAVRYLAKVLRDKADNLPDHVQAVGEAPLDKKGNINFIAYAKMLKEAKHAWYATAVKKVSTDKGFD